MLLAYSAWSFQLLGSASTSTPILLDANKPTPQHALFCMIQQSMCIAAHQLCPSPAELDKLKELQRQTGSAYIPLTGKFKPSSNTAAFSDEPSGLSSARTAMAATPMLGGGLTPLSGNKKVEMMLGISKAGGSSNGTGSMPPPPPRQ